MKAEQIRVLEAVVSAMKISNSDLEDWFKTRKRGNFIPTDLPLVYCKGNEFFVENGLNLKRKKELWGIQLLSGVMVALKYGWQTMSSLEFAAQNSIFSTAYKDVKKFVEIMRFNGRQGFIPFRSVLDKHWGKEEKEKFEATVEILRENGIDADDYNGAVWCVDDIQNTVSTGYAHCFIFGNGRTACYSEDTVSIDDRVAVAF